MRIEVYLVGPWVSLGCWSQLLWAGLSSRDGYSSWHLRGVSPDPKNQPATLCLGLSTLELLSAASLSSPCLSQTHMPHKVFSNIVKSLKWSSKFLWEIYFMFTFQFCFHLPCRSRLFPYNSQLPDDFMITELYLYSPIDLLTLMTALEGITAVQFVHLRRIKKELTYVIQNLPAYLSDFTQQ